LFAVVGNVDATSQKGTCLNKRMLEITNGLRLASLVFVPGSVCHRLCSSMF
jgi:hypothetical protein